MPLDATSPGFAPGEYIVTFEASSGVNSFITTQYTVKITMVDPCPVHAVLSINTDVYTPGSTVTHRLRDAMIPYSWDLTTLATMTGV